MIKVTSLRDIYQFLKLKNILELNLLKLMDLKYILNFLYFTPLSSIPKQAYYVPSALFVRVLIKGHMCFFYPEKFALSLTHTNIHI